MRDTGFEMRNLVGKNSKLEARSPKQMKENLNPEFATPYAYRRYQSSIRTLTDVDEA
jgi:hypothetical protein